MSAYASLPGSFLPPFFAFGAPSATDDDSAAPAVTEGHQEDTAADTTLVQPNSAQPQPNDELVPPFDALDISCKVDASAGTAPPSSSSSQPSDISIAIQSARVDPVALIKSLTSKGSNIARRTANFIARTPDEPSSNDKCVDETDTAGGSDSVTTVSSPGLCYEDSDSDEEYSMYDYSNDFSTPAADADAHDETHHEDAQCQNTDEDPSAIEFEMSITFQGRKYNATRAFPTFVTLRNNLLREVNESGEGATMQSLRRSRSRRSAGGTTSLDSMSDDDASDSNTTVPDATKVSVPELPRVSPENLGHTGYALSGVARSGFALLQATAQHYCPEMERWMRQVVDAFPCSQSLSNFLWEPLSSSNESWGTIGEGNESSGVNDGGTSEEKSSDKCPFAKPPLHSRTKPRSSNSSSSKPFRYKSKGSVGSRSASSLGSIDEGPGDDCDEHSL